MFYIITITASALIIAIANTLFAFSPTLLLQNIAITALGVVAIIAEDALSALLIRRLTPKSLYKPNRRFFNVSTRERNFYARLRIKKWKDYVPELGVFTGFSKSEIKNSNDPEYLERFIIESNYGVVIHIANALLGFVIAFIPLCSAPSIWIPIYAVNFILCILPVAILRYTSHTLLKLYNRSQKK
jgi:hypothetical protein